MSRIRESHCVTLNHEIRHLKQSEQNIVIRTASSYYRGGN